MRCSVDGRPNRNNKVAFSNLSGIVWTRPQCPYHVHQDRCEKMSKKHVKKLVKDVKSWAFILPPREELYVINSYALYN